MASSAAAGDRPHSDAIVAFDEYMEAHWAARTILSVLTSQPGHEYTTQMEEAVALLAANVLLMDLVVFDEEKGVMDTELLPSSRSRLLESSHAVVALAVGDPESYC